MMSPQLEQEPLADWALMRSTSVHDTEAAGAKLLARHRLRLIDASAFDARINGVSLPGVSLYYLSYQAPLAVVSPAMNDFVAICLPLQGGFELRQGRSRFEAYAGRGAAVVTPDDPFVMEWSPNLSMFVVKIDLGPLRRFAASVGAHPDSSIAFQREVISRKSLESLLGCARLTEITASQLPPGHRIPPSLASRIRDQMLLTVLVAQPNSLSAKLTTDDRSVGRGAVRKAVDFIEADPAAANPRALAKDAGVSLRALEMNFQDTLGTTPHAYILKTRLRRAHDELLAADKDFGLTVADVAARWGFTNMGRFAEQYGRVYQEKPSDTLKATQGVRAARSPEPVKQSAAAAQTAS